MSTFIPGFSDVGRFRSDKDLITTYKIMRDIALRFELRLAELYIGHEVLSVLRSAYPVFVVPATKTLYEMVRVAELRFISSRISQPHCGDMECVDAHEVWHLARPVIASLPMCPELYTAWCRDMRGDDMSAFKHKKQGGIFL